MPYLFRTEIMQHSVYTWLPKVKVRTQVIYTIVLLSILAALAALPFIYVDVSVAATGLVRPVIEKNELHSMVAGTIDKIFVKDGERVTQGQVLLRLQTDINNSKLLQNSLEMGEKETYIHDLTILASGDTSGLRSALYQQQYNRSKSSLLEQEAAVNKLKSDMEMYEKLYDEKVIAKKEYADRKYDYEKSMATYQSTLEQQRSTWQEELSRLRMESVRLQADNRQLSKEKEWNLIKAPVSGTMQQFYGRYPGSYVQANDLLGVISPDSNLVAECYVSPKDIGYLRKDMPVKFQVEAFNYNEWGVVEGKITSIDNDFILMDNKPVFKVKCIFNNTEVSTVKGVKGTLKKGMTLQARFILTKRSLYQLLYDKTDDWMNPGRKQKVSS
ncbi:MAG TPA: HlyD family efflux transporter periplasmic adaptor subunit [Chitinophaga sp.]|uniref:HlyD family secretion protein n=1 Tax=Chitinophaga sp. TaxID=1869181 RepID=UPI002CAC9710|nr:HlyD family efflux transporter periplasmic adaptor subunit [Chitinophaga sp.]HVI43786.1 HlyD family efflux transporter periplasmic adaptor subunit [Chitinophaga sp.]